MLTLTRAQLPEPALLGIHPVTITVPPATTATPSGGGGRGPVAFTGEWLAYGCDCHTYHEGYDGILSRRWNGWAVFTVTRPVAQAIVARQQRMFTDLMQEHIAAGAHPSDAWLSTAGCIAAVTWLGDMIVVDSRILHHDEASVEISAPSADRRYSIGWSWTWDDVDAADIHTIHTGGSR